MAWSFGDSFDLYAAPADMVNGYWDAGGNQLAGAFVAGRFTGSQALSVSGSSFVLVKTSGVNDAVHHFALAFRQTAAISGTTPGLYLQLIDGSTAQCSIVFRTDGSIYLYAGSAFTTLLASYTGAFSVQNTWYAFELEVVINNTTGSFTVRKNGNSTADFTATSLNTRVSANNYANKLQIGMNTTVNTQQIDDLFWQSGAATGGWLGDIRCYARMPASDQSVVFSRSAATFALPPFSGSVNSTISLNVARYIGFISQGSSLTGATATLAVGYTGNMKCAVFACVGGTLGAAASVGAILGTATASINNPVVGANVFTFSPAISLPSGTLFYVGICSDTTDTNGILAGNIVPYSTYGATSSTTYASFPVASPTLTSTQTSNFNVAPTFTIANNLFVNEPQEDGLTTYVYDSNPGDADFYGIASIGSTPATVIATVVRGYMQKSDAGTRTAAVQLKSGATTVASPTLTLTTSGWLWAWRLDLTDPNTGAAWTASAVNNAQIGPTVIA
jgi:hypothetical protein